MAGKIIADTLETGAGADIATSYVVNGSAKAWMNLDGSGTVAIRQSFSISGVVDNGTGSYTISFTTAFSDSDYCCVANSQNSTDTPNIGNAGCVDRTTSSFRIDQEIQSGAGGGQFDADIFDVAAFR